MSSMTNVQKVPSQPWQHVQRSKQSLRAKEKRRVSLISPAKIARDQATENQIATPREEVKKARVQGKKGKPKAKELEMVVVAANDEEKKLFTFTCTSDYAVIADKLDVPKSKLGTCIDSGVSCNYCPDHSKFTNYKEVQQKIMTADGGLLSAVGMGDLHIELPNGSEKIKTVFRNTVHTPGMAFTLISISKLDKAGFLVTFNKGMCTIKTTSPTQS
jgi:hypothetical protein